MKGKRLVSLALAALLLLPVSALAAGESEELWTRSEGDGSYVTIRLPYSEGEELSWAQTQNLCVRYADTKEPVALSSGYQWDGCLFATVPAGDADRSLEVFQGEPTRFTDCITVWQDYEYDDTPIGTDRLNLRGIILGDDAGNLNADTVITRAEAFTLIVRLLSLEPDGDPGFADVSPEDWYFETASAVKAAGITNQEDYFYPERPVTRGEITVMVCRAMKTVGWLEETAGTGLTAEELNYADAADIPDWALPSYLALTSHWVAPILTWAETGEVSAEGLVYEVLAEQEKGAARGEVIEFLSSTLSYLPCYPRQNAIELGFDKEMPVIDGSTSTYPYTTAVFASLFANYGNHPQFPDAHSKSYYSYDRLINGEADILFISTKPTEDTLRKAEEAGVELELYPIAYDAMVFFTNGENSIDNLTMDQIRDIYVDDAYDNWSELGGPDAGLIPYCRNADSGSQAQMEEFFLKGDEIHPDIRRETTAVSMASVLTDVWDARTDDPPAYALGYSIYYYYQSASMILLSGPDDLKLLSIEGVYPTEETIADGSYPLAGYNYAVVRSDEPEGSPARRMVEFMLSEQGQQCVVNAGFGALK